MRSATRECERTGACAACAQTTQDADHVQDADRTMSMLVCTLSQDGNTHCSRHAHAQSACRSADGTCTTH